MWFHRLGTPGRVDRYVIGREFPRIAEIELHGNRDGRELVAAVKNGDGGEIAYYLRRAGAPWRQVAGFTDGIKQMRIVQDGHLYARSIKDAPLGRILAIPLADARLARARVVVPEARLSADGLAVGRSRLYVQYRDGGPSITRMFASDGNALGAIPAQPLSGLPVLLRTEAAAGHGIGTALSIRIEEATDVFTFLVDQLGITGPVKSP